MLPALWIEMPCPTIDDILAFLEGRLAASDSTRIEVHVDSCDECRELLATLGKAAVRSREPSGSGQKSLSPKPPPPRVQPAEAPVGLLAMGERVDQYTIVRLIGRGGMGEVYLARDSDLRRRAALKVLRSETLALRDASERVLREARTTARFAHPNIVAIHGVGRVRGAPYLALEYVPGETLRQRLLRGPVTRPDRDTLIASIAEALCEAHRHHVMHGDLKPSNVLIGDDGRVRVLDFGLARVLREQSGAPLDITEVAPGHDEPSAAIQGTPAYMAPEQWAGAPSTLSSDIWSFGVILYEMACGRPPFTLTAVARQEVDLEDALSRGASSTHPLSPEEISLLRRCLLVNATERARADDLSCAFGKPAPALFEGRTGTSTSVSEPQRSEAPQARTAPPPTDRRRSSPPALWVVVTAALVFVAAFVIAGQSLRGVPQPAGVGSSNLAAPRASVIPSAVEPLDLERPVRMAASTSSAVPSAALSRPSGPRATPPASATSWPVATAAVHGSAPPAGVGYISLNALRSLEEKAEDADREATSTTDARQAQAARDRAALYRRLADDQLSGVEREVARTPDMPVADAARLREYVRKGREFLAQRRASTGARRP